MNDSITQSTNVKFAWLEHPSHGKVNFVWGNYEHEGTVVFESYGLHPSLEIQIPNSHNAEPTPFRLLSGYRCVYTLEYLRKVWCVLIHAGWNGPYGQRSYEGTRK